MLVDLFYKRYRATSRERDAAGSCVSQIRTRSLAVAARCGTVSDCGTFVQKNQ